jgi:hypothetical protein
MALQKPRLLITVATTVFGVQLPGLLHRQRQDREDLVAVDELPSASTARQRSASPSKAMPRSAPVLDDRGLQVAHVGGAAVRR